MIQIQIEWMNHWHGRQKPEKPFPPMKRQSFLLPSNKLIFFRTNRSISIRYSRGVNWPMKMAASLQMPLLLLILALFFYEAAAIKCYLQPGVDLNSLKNKRLTVQEVRELLKENKDKWAELDCEEYPGLFGNKCFVSTNCASDLVEFNDVRSCVPANFAQDGDSCPKTNRCEKCRVCDTDFCNGGDNGAKGGDNGAMGGDSGNDAIGGDNGAMGGDSGNDAIGGDNGAEGGDNGAKGGGGGNGAIGGGANLLATVLGSLVATIVAFLMVARGL